jgi:hypothetical protein
MICTPHQTLFGRPNQEELNGQGKSHVCETGEVNAGFWWKDVGESDHLNGLRKDGRKLQNGSS